MSEIAKKAAFLVGWNTLRALEYLEQSKWGCLAIMGSVKTLYQNHVTQESCGATIRTTQKTCDRLTTCAIPWAQ